MTSDDQEIQAPLLGNYPLTVAFVLLALCPDLFWSTSVPLLRPEIARDLHASAAALQLGETFSNAGWAFGAVLAADLAQRFHNYRLNLIYEGAFILGSILGAIAPTAAVYDAGRIVQGTATGMLLVSALPPLIRNFGVGKLSATVGFTDIGLFGAVAAGPLIGGYVALTGTWRWFFATSALLGLFAWILIWLVVQRGPGYNPELRFDWKAIALAGAGAGLAFYGLGQLQGSPGWTTPIVWVPAVLGIACTVVLIVYQYHANDALIPVKPLAKTYPVVGILVGVLGGMAFTGLLELLIVYMQQVVGLKPFSVGVLLWPGLATALLGALIFSRFFGTRYVLLLPLGGMLALVVAAWLLTTITTTTGTGLVLWVAGLLGLGASLTVSPGLFMAGLSVRPNLIGRAFALVELLRLAGAFAFAPAFLYFATALGNTPARLVLGMHIVFWVILLGSLGTIALATAIFFAGGGRVHPPDLVAYIERNEEAMDSPAFGEAVRRGELGGAIRGGVLSAFGADRAGQEASEPHGADRGPADRAITGGEDSGVAREGATPSDDATTATVADAPAPQLTTKGTAREHPPAAMARAANTTQDHEQGATEDARRLVVALEGTLAALREALHSAEGEREELWSFLDGSPDALDRLEEWTGRLMGLDLRHSPERVRRLLPLEVVWVLAIRRAQSLALLESAERSLGVLPEQIERALDAATAQARADEAQRVCATLEAQLRRQLLSELGARVMRDVLDALNSDAQHEEQSTLTGAR